MPCRSSVSETSSYAPNSDAPRRLNLGRYKNLGPTSSTVRRLITYATTFSTPGTTLIGRHFRSRPSARMTLAELLSGPILKTKLSFFSYEGLRLRQPQTASGDFFTASARVAVAPVYQTDSQCAALAGSECSSYRPFLRITSQTHASLTSPLPIPTPPPSTRPASALTTT